MLRENLIEAKSKLSEAIDKLTVDDRIPTSVLKLLIEARGEISMAINEEFPPKYSRETW